MNVHDDQFYVLFISTYLHNADDTNILYEIFDVKSGIYSLNTEMSTNTEGLD